MLIGGLTPRAIIQRPLFFPLLILIAFILINDRFHFFSAPSVPDQLLDQTSLYEGILREAPRVNDGKVKLKVLLQRKIDGETKPVDGTVLLTMLGESLPIRDGDAIRFEAKLKKPVNYKNPGGFDYVRYLSRQGITATGFIADPARVTLVRSFSVSHLQRGMERLKEQTRNLLLSKTDELQAGILMALLWGDESLISDKTEQLFRDQGINHLLVISGLHFATLSFLFFELCLGLARLFPSLLLRINVRRPIAGLTFLFLTYYYLFCVSSPSITRAYIAVSAYLAAMILNRSRDLLNILFLAALLILLVQPSDLFNLSFQLSFASVLSLIFIFPILKKLFNRQADETQENQRGLRKVLFLLGRGFLDLVLVNGAIFIGLTPLIVFYFHQIPPFGVFMNLWAVPLFELVIVPLGLGALFLQTIWQPFASFLFSIDIGLIELALSILNWGALHFPDPLMVFPPRSWELGFYAALILILVLKIRPSVKWSLAGTICFIFLIDLGYNYREVFLVDRFRVTQIDVGQGDSLLVELPGAKRVLIDGGGSPYFDMGRNVVLPFLLHRRIPKLDAVCITHADTDHYLGLQALLDHYRVEQVWWNGVPDETPEYQKLFETAKRKGIPIIPLMKGMTFSLGQADHWTVLNPAADDIVTGKDNNRSVVLHLEVGGHTALFTGDLESWGEFKLLQMNVGRWTLDVGRKTTSHVPAPEGSGRPTSYENPLHADYLKVGHHGSKTSSSEAFLSAVSPQVATMGVGVKNRFHHPASEVVERFERFRIPLYRTDQQGALVIDFEGNRITTTSFVK